MGLAAWLHLPAQRIPWRFESGGSSAQAPSPGEPRPNSSHLQSKEAAAATLWRPGRRLSDILGPGSERLQENQGLLPVIHQATSRTSAFTTPFDLFISTFFLLSLPLLPLFRLEWIRYQDVQRGPFRLLRLASLRAGSFKNAPAQEESWGNNSQASCSVFYTAPHKHMSTWASGLQAER